MQIVAYEPSLFSALAAAARGAAAGHSLGHRSFVDHYYATVPWCRLYLALGDDGAVAGAIGVEQLRFEYEGRPLTIGCASNFVAFQPGAGGVLFLRWIRSSEMACIYGGSRDTHRILAHQGWTYFPGVHVYSLNGRYTDRPAEPRWRGVAKSLLRAVTPRVDVGERLRGAVARGVVPAVNVAEVDGFDADMLPRAGGFTFRLAPGTEYLGWRYSPALPFVRYRLFRLPRGYVVLNERPGRIVVAQADATDPDSLVGGVLAAVAQVAGEGSRPEVLLHEEDGQTLEPYERITIDIPPEFIGEVQHALAGRKARLEQMTTDADGRVRMELVLPVRGLIGYRGQLLTDTRGTALLHQIGEGYGPWAGEVTHRTNGVLVADRTGVSNAFGLFNLEERGELFIGAGEEVYEGMIIGECSRSGDMNVNATKAKQLTNIRTHSHDESLRLTPPRPLTLESAIEFIATDELVEVTPHSIRLRKRALAEHQRRRERGREDDLRRAAEA